MHPVQDVRLMISRSGINGRIFSYRPTDRRGTTMNRRLFVTDPLNSLSSGSHGRETKVVSSYLSFAASRLVRWNRKYREIVESAYTVD